VKIGAVDLAENRLTNGNCAEERVKVVSFDFAKDKN